MSVVRAPVVDVFVKTEKGDCSVWTYVKLILTVLPGELNLEEAAVAFNEAEMKGGGLPAIVDAIITHKDKVFPDPLTRPIAVLTLEGISHLYHGTPKPQSSDL